MIDFWWLNFWYSLPLIGRLARLSRDTTRYARDESWTNTERTLCEDYKNFVPYDMGPLGFRQRIVYLSKARDVGRTPLPAWLIAVLALLVIAEGLGFSYLLGSWIAMEGSENVRVILMLAIVFVLCVIVLFIMHAAGHQLHRTTLIRRCDKEWRDAGQRHRGVFVPLSEKPILLDDDQTADDTAPAYSQCISRVGKDGSYAMVVIAVVLIVGIASGSTWMRIQHLEAQQTRETLGSGETNAGNPFAGTPPQATQSPLPKAVTDPHKNAAEQGQKQVTLSERGEGLAAFILLAFIFVATQIMAITAGFRWGFTGLESENAYKGTRGFSVYDEYQRYAQPILQKAQSKLQLLQKKLRENAGEEVQLKHNFLDCLREKREPDEEQLGKEQLINNFDALRDKESQDKFIRSLGENNYQTLLKALKERENRKSRGAEIAAYTIANPLESARSPHPQKTAATDTAQLLQEFDAQPDSESKKRWADNLDKESGERLVAALKDRKTQAAKRLSDEISEFL